MPLKLWPSALIIGQSTKLGTDWNMNDGIVNTISMTHPFDSKMIYFDGNPVTGVWQLVKRLNMDHRAVIGHSILRKELQNIIVLYKNHCALLYGLR